MPLFSGNLSATSLTEPPGNSGLWPFYGGRPLGICGTLSELNLLI